MDHMAPYLHGGNKLLLDGQNDLRAREWDRVRGHVQARRKDEPRVELRTGKPDSPREERLPDVDGEVPLPGTCSTVDVEKVRFLIPDRSPAVLIQMKTEMVLSFE